MDHSEHLDLNRRWCKHCSLICAQAGMRIMWLGFVLLVAALWKPVAARSTMHKGALAMQMTDERAEKAYEELKKI